MLKDNFAEFCKTVLEYDKGAGANCELVRAFLKERDTSVESAEVEQMVRDRLLELRGAKNFEAGLCHPSSKLRDLLLSEMRQFKMPADEMIAALQETAEDATCLWHTRRAAILSIAQVAQMEQCSHGRAGVLKWMLKMFDAESHVLKDVQFALIKGLGTLLQSADKNEKQVDDCIVLSQGDEEVLLQILEHADNFEVAEAIADLKLFCDRLVDWLLSDGRSHLISAGNWPFCHVLLICAKTAVALAVDQSFHGRASKLATLLVGRVHSIDFKISEHEALMQALNKIVDALGTCHACDLDPALHTFVQTGDVDQRIRVLRVLHEAKIPFEFESFDMLGLEQRNEPMLLEVMAELNMVSNSLVDWFLSKPHLVTKGGWPMRNVVCICNFLRASGSHKQASQLAETVLIRLQSNSFVPKEVEETVAVLAALQALLTQLPVVHFHPTRNMDKRIQMLRMLNKAKIPFEFESFDMLGLERRNEPMLLEVMAELNMVSNSLVDWFLSKPHLVTKGGWPMRNVVCICNFLRASGSHEQASQLAETVLIRLQSNSFVPEEAEETVAVLTALQALLTQLPVVHFPLTGNVDQRIQMLRMLNKAKIPFEFESLDMLGLEQRNEPMLLEVMAELNMVSDSLVDWFLSKPRLVTKGGWPMRNVVCICNVLRASGSHERATQLAETVLIRLHSTYSTSFQEERAEMIEILVALQAVLTHLPVVQLVQTGNVDQRILVLRVLHEAKIPFECRSFEYLRLQERNEPMLLEVMAELNMVSDRLLDWFLSKPLLVTEGVWPMRNVVCICNVLRASGSHERAKQLAENVLIRLHSTSFQQKEGAETIEALVALQALLTHLPVVHFPQTGNVDERIQMLRMLDEAKIPFEFEAFDNLGLEERNEPMLLEVIAELNMVSDRLVDWFLSKPLLVTEGVWPMRNVVCICNVLRASRSHEQATQLAETVLIRLHSTSFQEEERAKPIEALVALQALLTQLPVVRCLETGDASQRMRVLAAAAEAALVFETQSLVKLAQCLLHENIPKSSQISQKTEPCTNFTKGHCRNGAACRLAHGRHEVLCKKWINGTCTRGKECRYQHIEMESLLALVLVEEMDQKSQGSDMLHRKGWVFFGGDLSVSKVRGLHFCVVWRDSPRPHLHYGRVVFCCLFAHLIYINMQCTPTKYTHTHIRVSICSVPFQVKVGSSSSSSFALLATCLLL